MRTSHEEDVDDLARGASVQYLGFIARLGSRVPFLFLAARLFGESRFGTFTFGITVVETAAFLALFGMKRSLYKFMSEAVSRGEPLHGPIANGVALALSLGTLLTVTVGAASGPLAELFGLPSAARPLLVLTPAIFFIVVSDILLVAIRFTRQMRFEVYARSIAEPVTLTLSIVVLYWAGVRELGLVVGYVTSLAVAALATIYFFARLYSVRECLRVPLRWGEIRELATFSGPTAVHEFLTVLSTRADVFLVSYFMPASVVGVYGMARQFATVTKKIKGGFDRILPAVLSESITVAAMRRADDQLVTVSRWILTVELLVVLFFVFWADGLLALLEGAFAGGALIVVLLVLGDTVRGTLGASELPFVYLRPGVNVVFGVAYLLLVIGTNVGLIPRLGAEGAALGVLVSVSLVNGTRVLANRRMFDLAIVRPVVLKPLLAALPAAGAVLAFRQVVSVSPVVDAALGIPVLIAFYLGSLYLLGLEPEDRTQVGRLRKLIRLMG